MKRIALGLSLVFSLVLSQTAAADGRHYRHGFNDFRYGGSHFRSFDRGYNRHWRRGNSYHYGRVGGRRGGDFFGVSYGNRGFYNNFGYGYGYGWNRFDRRYRRGNGDFFGGLVVGSLLTNASYAPRAVETVRVQTIPTVRSREVRYVNSTSRAPVVTSHRRRLLRDLQGDCFEIVISPSGDEIRSQIDPSMCNY